ncbi:MAG: hypothetical protein Q4Q07_03235 [Tissierellia bacterium]|nr:hypothetical protein [Tissierellia bacterium]
MEKMLFYAMEGEKMCFLHALMNAFDLKEDGVDVKIVFEGKAVTLPKVLEEEKNGLYLKAKEAGIIAGVCKACSKMLEVLEANESFGLTILDDMNGHAGMKPYLKDGYEVVIF